MMNILPSSQLWLGPEEWLREEAILYLSNLFKGRTPQFHESQIRLRQHPYVIWLAPQKGAYKRVDLELLFERMLFALEDDEKFFFVIEQADLLGNFAGNNLLKVLEEPARGYHFLLLARGRDGILPTIVSRCVVREQDANQAHADDFHELVNVFLEERKISVSAFSQILDASGITDIQTPFVFKRLVTRFAEKAVVMIREGKTEAVEARMQALQKFHDLLPMPGNAKLFWRDLFLRFFVS